MKKILTPLDLPHLTTAQRDALPTEQRGSGAMIFNTTLNQPEVNKGTSGTPRWEPAGGGAPDVPTKLAQVLAAAAAAAIYTVPASKQTRIEYIRIANTDAVARSITLWDGGNGNANLILPPTEIPAGDWIELPVWIGMQTGGTIQAVASAASVIAVTLYGSVEDVGSKVYRKLGQGVLTATPAVIYTATQRTQVKHVRWANFDSAQRGASLFDGGSGAVNMLQQKTAPSSQIPAGGVMEEDVYLGLDAGGTLLSDATVTGVVTITVYGITDG